MRPTGRVVGAAVGAGLAGLAAWWLLRREQPPRAAHPLFRPRPQLVAHRGGGGLAPENTLEAFRRAAELWRADMIELDVRATADGACVVIHDETVARTTEGRGRVSGFTLEELRGLDAGYRFSPDGGRTHPFRGRGVRVPTIDEVLAELPGMPLVVEIKEAAAAAPLRRAIAAAGAEGRVCVAGERAAHRLPFRGYPGPVSAPSEALIAFYVLHRLGLGRLWAPAADVANLPEHHRGRRILTPGLVRGLHERGLAVHIWTVDLESDMRRLLDWGVDGILTDRPDLLARVLHERVGRPLPPGAAAEGAEDAAPSQRAVRSAER